MRVSFLRRPRRAVAVIAVAAATAALAGCGAMNPQIENPNYAAADGVAVSFNDQVTGENLLILTNGQNEPGVLIGALTNRTTATVTVALGLPNSSAPLATKTVPAGKTVLFGTSETAIPVPSVPAEPGATQDVIISATGMGDQTVQVPVLGNTFSEYATLIPTPTPTATTTAG